MTSPYGHCDVNGASDDTSALSEITLSTQTPVQLGNEAIVTNSDEVLDIFSTLDTTDFNSSGQSVQQNENYYDLLSLGNDQESGATSTGQEFDAFSLLDITSTSQVQGENSAAFPVNETQNQPLDLLGLFDNPPTTKVQAVERNEPVFGIVPSLADTAAQQSETSNLVDFFATQNVAETTENLHNPSHAEPASNFDWLMLDNQANNKTADSTSVPNMDDNMKPDNNLGLDFALTSAFPMSPTNQVDFQLIAEHKEPAQSGTNSIDAENGFTTNKTNLISGDNFMDIFGSEQEKTETREVQKTVDQETDNLTTGHSGNNLDFLSLMDGSEALESSKDSQDGLNSINLTDAISAGPLEGGKLSRASDEIGFVDERVNIHPAESQRNDDITTLCDVNKPESIIESDSIVTVSTKGHLLSNVDNVESSETSKSNLFPVMSQTESNDSPFDGQEGMFEPDLNQVNNGLLSVDDVYIVGEVNKSEMEDNMSWTNMSDDQAKEGKPESEVEMGNCVKSLCSSDSDGNNEVSDSKQEHQNPTFEEDINSSQVLHEHVPAKNESDGIEEEPHEHENTLQLAQANPDNQQISETLRGQSLLPDGDAQLDASEANTEDCGGNADLNELAEDVVTKAKEDNISIPTTDDDGVNMIKNEDMHFTEGVASDAETSALQMEPSNQCTEVDTVVQPLESQLTVDPPEQEQINSDLKQDTPITADIDTNLPDNDQMETEVDITTSVENSIANDSLPEAIESSLPLDATMSKSENLFQPELGEPVNVLSSSGITPLENGDLQESVVAETSSGSEPAHGDTQWSSLLQVETASAPLNSEQNLQTNHLHEELNMDEYSLQLPANLSLLGEIGETTDAAKQVAAPTLIPDVGEQSLNFFEADSDLAPSQKFDTDLIDQVEHPFSSTMPDSQPTPLVSTSEERTSPVFCDASLHLGPIDSQQLPSDISHEMSIGHLDTNQSASTSDKSGQGIFHETLNIKELLENQSIFSTSGISDERKHPDVEVMNPAPPPRGKKKRQPIAQDNKPSDELTEIAHPETVNELDMFQQLPDNETNVLNNGVQTLTEIDLLQSSPDDQADIQTFSLLSVENKASEPNSKQEMDIGKQQDSYNLDLFQTHTPTNPFSLEENTGENLVDSEIPGNELEVANTGFDEMQNGDNVSQDSLEHDNNTFGTAPMTTSSRGSNEISSSTSVPETPADSTLVVDMSFDQNLFTTLELSTSQQLGFPNEIEDNSAVVMTTKEPDSNANLLISPDIPDNTVVQEDELTEGHLENELQPYSTTKWTEDQVPQTNTNVVDVLIPGIEEEKSSPAAPETLQLHTHLDEGNPAPPPRGKKKSVKKEKFEEELLDVNKVVDEGVDQNGEADLFTKPMDPPQNNELVDLVMSTKPDFPTLELTETSSSAEQFPLDNFNVHPDTLTTEELQPDATLKDLEFESIEQTKVDTTEKEDKEQGNMLLDVTPNHDEEEISSSICSTNLKHVTDINYDLEATAMFSIENQEATKLVENLSENMPMAPPRGKKKIAINVAEIEEEFNVASVTGDCEQIGLNIQINPGLLNDTNVLEIPLGFDTENQSVLIDTQDTNMNLKGISESGSQGNSDQTFVNKSSLQNLLEEKSESPNENGSFVQQNTEESNVTDDSLIIKTNDAVAKAETDKKNSFINKVETAPVELHEDEERLPSSSEEGSLFGSDQINVSDLDDSDCGEMQLGDNISQISLEFDDNPFESTPVAPLREKRKIDLNAAYLRHEPVNVQSNIVPSTVFMEPDDMLEDNDSAKVENALNNDLQQMNNEVFVEESLFAGQTNLNNLRSVVGSGTLVSFDSDWEEFQQSGQPINTLPVIEEESEPEENDEDQESDGLSEKSFEEIKDLVEENMKDLMDSELDDDDDDLATQYNHLWGERSAGFDSSGIEESLDTCLAPPEAPGNAEIETLLSTNPTSHSVSSLQEPLESDFPEDGKSQLEKDLDESPTTTEGSWCILDQTSDYEDWKDTYTEPSTTNEQLILSGESKIADTDLIDVYTSQTQNSEDQTTSTTDEKENDGFFNEATIVSSGENLIQDKGSVPTENDKDMLETPKPLNVTDLKAEVTDNDLTDWTINTIERNENLEGDSIQDAIHESSDGDLVGMENSIGKTTIVHANEESDGDGETSLVKKGDQPSSGDVHTLEPSRNVDFAVTEDSVGTTTIDHSHEESQNVELLEPGEIKPCDKLFEHFIPVTNAENDVNMLPEIQTTDETSNVSSITPDKGPSNMFDDETATQSQTGPTPMLQGQHDIDTETPDVTHNQEVISQYNNNLLSFGEGETTEKYITVPVHVKPNNIDDTNNMDSSPDIDTNLDSKSFEVLGIGSAQNVEHHDIFKEEVLTPLDTSVQEQENVEDAEIAKNCQVSMNEDDLVTHDEEKHLEEMVTAVSTEITAKTETYKEEQVYDEQHTISANTLEFEDLLDPVNLPTSEPVPNLQNNAKESSIDRDASEFPLNTDAPMIGNEEMTFQPTEPTQEENRDAEKLMDENNLLKPMIADFMLERENIAVLVEAPASDDVALNNGNPNTDTKLIDSLTPANQVESMVTSIKSQTSVPEDGMPVDKAINLQPDDNESCTESDKQNKRVVVDESLFGEQELHSTGIEEIVLEQTENAAELEEQNIPVKLDETVPLKEVSDVEVTTEVNLLPGHIDESLFGEKGPDSTTVEESVPYTQGAVHEVEIQNQDFTTNEGSLLNAPNNVHVDEAGAQNQDTTEVQEVLVDNHVNSEQQLEDVVQSDVTAAGDFDPFSFTGEIDNNPQLITDIADKIELATEESDAKTHDQADLVQVTDEATSEHVDQIYRVPTNSFQDLNVGDQIFADPVSVKPLKKLHLQPDEAGTNTEEEQEFTRETNRVRYDTIGSIDMLTDSSEDENETQEQFNAAKAELVSIDLKNDADDRDATNETVSPTSSLRRRSIVPPSSLVLSIALDDINVQTPTQETQVDGPSAPSIGSNSSSAAASSNGEKTDPEILLPTIPATMKEDPVWENVVIGNEDYRIDGRAIQNYKRVISHGGFYKEKQAIVEIFGRYLPDSSVPNYIWVMDNLFLYLVSTLELLVQHQDYVVVFFNGSVSKNHFPSTSWLKKSHLQVPYHLRKNLKGFYVVQSSFYFKTLTGLTRMFLSRKVFKKTKNVKNHTELKQFIPTDFLFIPQDIASKSSNSLNDEQVNKKWWWSR